MEIHAEELNLFPDMFLTKTQKGNRMISNLPKIKKEKY